MNSAKTYPFPLNELVCRATLANRDYYESGQSAMSDGEFDSLRRLIIDQCNKLKINPNEIPVIASVGFPAKENKIKHITKMYSLDNLYDTENLGKFLQRTRTGLIGQVGNLLDSQPVSYGLEYKIDGMSLDLTYRFGRLTSAITRGDGLHGENLLANVLSVEAIPKELMHRDANFNVPLLVVHGELYVKKSDLKNYVLSPQCDIRSTPQNCRAAVASIRSGDFATKGIRLSFNPHEIAAIEMNPNEEYNYPDDLLSESMYDRLQSLTELGFTRSSPLSPPIQSSNLRDVIQSIEILYSKVLDERSTEEFDLPIDGVVISVDQLEYRSLLGHTARVPRWAMAYKFPALGAKTIIRRLAWQVTASGNLVPVLKIDPVSLSGVTITSVALHSAGTFKSKELHHLDTITVVRKADVTPFVSEVHPEMRSEESAPIQTPVHCPSCQSVLRSTMVHIQCLNKVCPDQLIAKLTRFVSKQGMDIRAFGKYGITQLFERGTLKYPSDIYKLANDQRQPRSNARVGILESIEKSKSQDFLILLKALMVPKTKLGYKHIVETHADLLAWINDVVDNSFLHDPIIHDYVKDNFVMLSELYHFGVGHVNVSFKRSSDDEENK